MNTLTAASIGMLAALVPHRQLFTAEEPERVNICQSDPVAYNHKLIEVSAFVSLGFEDFTLFDPNCAAWPSVWLESSSHGCAGYQRKTYTLVMSRPYWCRSMPRILTESRGSASGTDRAWPSEPTGCMFQVLQNEWNTKQWTPECSDSLDNIRLPSGVRKLCPGNLPDGAPTGEARVLGPLSSSAGPDGWL